LVIADDASADPAIAVCLAECNADPRMNVTRLAQRGGISVATNAALALADGDYVAFLDHDDRLAPHALAAAACAFVENPKLELVFSDEDQLVNGRRTNPYFKPGCNMDLFQSQNLVCHLAVYRRTLVTQLGGMRGDVVGAQDYDLALSVVDHAGPHRVRHLPLVLYHWRQSAKSFSARDADACRAAARRALSRHLVGHATIEEDTVLPQWPAVRFNLPQPAPSVSLITPNAAAIEGAYDPALVACVPDAARATGDVLVFLSGRLRPVDADWLSILVANASRPDIGAAGALLLGKDGRRLHTGFVLHPKQVARCVAPPSDDGDPGYRGQFARARTVSAVSGDCFAIRREAFTAAGGFTSGAGDFAAVDLCLRLAERGLRTVWTPHAKLRYAAAPRAPSSGAAWMRQRWASVLAADPYLNPNLRVVRGRLLLAKPA
jgi:GT2 family glycosyltransferase